MIGRLKGIIVEKHPPHLLVEVMGVGYEVQAPMTSFYPLPDVGEEVLLHTHLSISENSHQLFAFYTLDERRLFRILIKVSGVGPKMALGILSGLPVSEFVRYVTDGNTTALVTVPGVGRKTAERLIIEVRDRLRDWQGEDGPALKGKSVPSDQQVCADIGTDAESALIALGYRPTDAARLVSSVQKTSETTSSEELIRLALQSMVANR